MHPKCEGLHAVSYGQVKEEDVKVKGISKCEFAAISIEEERSSEKSTLTWVREYITAKT